ncbi:SMa0974 family conjugal transfer regulator [Rhizobium rhizogenes]|uniref:SMa0974 family conjugal transfer regulator n=1 Tax=Rhizobium rhizogenes TaxID=359 RepID=UPI003D663050
MYEHVAETYVPLSNANCSLDQLCSTITAFSHSVIEKGPERAFAFEGGHAIVRLVNSGLLFLVTAENILIFFGIRTVLETSLSKISRSIPEWIRWYPTRSAHSPSPNA